jgi:Peptidase family M1 domain
MPALTETEAAARAALIEVASYDVFADLTAEPQGSVRSRTEIRFTCAQPGAATFADLTARAVSAVLNGREVGPPDDGRLALPGLMAENTLVVEAEAGGDVLIRFTDPTDDVGYALFTGYPTLAPICAHEVSHLWFGCHISARWWDDLWLDEAMASYVSYPAMAEARMADPWTALSYREKPRAYEADALPGRQPVSSPVATAADAMFRPVALTYSKGTAVIRQLAALIGDDALRAGLRDYMRRFGGGTASLDDLIGCWSRSSGRDLGGWAREWLRTEGASTLRASVQAAADGTIGRGAGRAGRRGPGNRGAEPGGLPGRAAGRRGQGGGVGTGARRHGRGEGRWAGADGGGGERAVGTRPGGAAGQLPGPVLRRGAARAGRAGHPPDAAAGPGALPGHAGRARDAGGDRVGGEA